MSRRRVLGSALVFAGAMLLGLFAFGGSSRAETGVAVDAWVRWRSAAVAEVTLDGSSLADPALRERIARGLPLRLALRASVPSAAGRVLRTARTCRVVQDVWEHGYVVTTGEGTERVADVEAVLERCLVLEARSATTLGGTPASLAAASALTLELNPTSARTERALSGWLSRSEGGRGEPTFFGALIAPTVFEDEPAERTIRARVRVRAELVESESRR